MKIGFTCGVFDLFHAGHVLMLQECKAHYLIVALNKAQYISTEINPGKNAPIFTIEERVLIMKACRYVDEVLIYDSEDMLLHLMLSKKIDIRFLGEDYRGRTITGADIGVEIYYTDRSHGLSTSQIRKRIVH
jgi:glycerol-3-phosphate cytidylyltransferase